MGEDDFGDGGFDEYLDQPLDQPPPVAADRRPLPPYARRVSTKLVVVALLIAVALVAAGVGASIGSGDDASGPKSAGTSSSSGASLRATTPTSPSFTCIVGARPSRQSTSQVVMSVGDCAAGIQEIRVEPVSPLGPIVSVSDLASEQGGAIPCAVAAGVARCSPMPPAGVGSVSLVTVGFGDGTRAPDAKARVTFVRRDGSTSELLVPIPAS